MQCGLRLRVSVTCTFTIKHGTHVPVVTCSHLQKMYMTRVDYNALLTSLIAKTCLVQWIECQSPDLGVDVTVRITATADTFFLFIEKLTEYFQTFI